MQARFVCYVPRIIPDETGRGFTASCDELGMSASAGAEAEARYRLRITVRSYLHALNRRDGLLEEALIGSGIKVVSVPISIAAAADGEETVALDSADA